MTRRLALALAVAALAVLAVPAQGSAHNVRVSPRFGTFGDDTSTSVNMPDVKKSEREKELERTSDLTREVAQNAADLRAQMAQIVQEARRKHAKADSHAEDESTESSS